MADYTPPLKDIDFILHQLLRVSESDAPGYDALDAGTTGAVLEEAGRIAAEVLAPLNEAGDRQGCTLENGVVRTPEGFRAAYDTLREGGWMGLDLDPDHGGQGMPYLLNTAVLEMFVSANMALNMYQGLTHGAYSALHAHGSEAQKRIYLPKLASGDWAGTMNLTEPQCGTDLGLIRTRADPADDGSYRITGEKIFISAGEHDLTGNIIHLVLARAPGGGEGTKGISLFVVPKFLPDEQGAPGARNALSCGKLERKMGIHGNATCVMNYDGATGWLVGEAHKGLRAMFTMMNEARIGVGLQGYAVAEGAWQIAREYARDRLQGRAAGGAANPDGPADPIIVHPDVRRMLMEQKSFVEGARAFTFWGAELIDRARAGDDEAEALVSLLTPVIKGFLTDKGFDACVAAQQVLGGHGYIEEWGVSQFVRDARIAMIYEGTNGVQALDLVGRKLGGDGGRTAMAFFKRISDFLSENAGNETLEDGFLGPLKAAADDMQAAATFFMKHGMKSPEEALAGSTDFMHLMGHVCLGYVWARMAGAAAAALGDDGADRAFLEAKIATGRFYMARQLPATALHRARIESGAAPVMALSAEAF